MNVKFSSQKFPYIPSVKDASGAIWGCVVQPFTNIELTHGSNFDIDRCRKCFAYINCYVVREPNNSYKCVLCGATNKIESDRYLRLALSDPDQVPELQFNNLILENTVAADNSLHADHPVDNNFLHLQQLEEYKEFANNPIYIAVVDHSGSEEQINTIHNGLEALIHALPDNCLFGMIIYSQKIGVFNFNTALPSLKYIDVISSNNEDISFDDILPLTSFLVNKAKFETNILNAINVLPQIESAVNKKRAVRALGPTIDMLLDYLSFDNIKFNVKVGLFLCGNPVFGDGTVEKDYTTLESLYTTYQDAAFLKPSTTFYQKQAERASLLGVHFDMYCIGAKYFGLDSIKFLTSSTGGNLYRYTQIGPKCQLPQDIYKLISNGWGFHGLLRIRTSKNYTVDNCFGNIIPSKNYENLYHIESCSSFTSFAFDFKFTDPSTFEFKTNPYIQIAFSYSYLEPLNNNNNGSGEVDESSGSSGGGNIRVIKKRLQIYTVHLQVATTPTELFHSMDLETTITLLTHKIIKESLEKGIVESRLLLLDWITNIMTLYNENVVIASSIQQDVDMTFSHVPQLRPLPRYVFALLKSKLLRTLSKGNEESALATSSDEWIFSQCLLQSLEPRLLHRAIYPVLYTYGAPNNLASKYVALSMNSIKVSISHIYLLDTYDKMIVYYSPSVSDQHSFPPAPDSLIRQTIVNSKQDRLIVPEVIYTRGSLDEEARQFSDYLLEEDNAQGQSFVNFIRELSLTIHKVLSS